jgi:cation transport regulator ChaC
LLFHKKSLDGSAKCDAFETKNNINSVHGVVYRISKSHKAVLDRIEGVGLGYEEKTVELTTPPGEILLAYTYYAIQITHTYKPYHWYKHHVLTGALEYDLPGTYVERLLKVDSMEDPNPKRQAAEIAIYKDIETATDR